MNKIKGPAIFLAQFVGEEAPFNSLDNICKWASSLGYKGIQICLLYTSPSPRDVEESRMPSSA